MSNRIQRKISAHVYGASFNTGDKHVCQGCYRDFTWKQIYGHLNRCERFQALSAEIREAGIHKTQEIKNFDQAPSRPLVDEYSDNEVILFDGADLPHSQGRLPPSLITKKVVLPTPQQANAKVAKTRGGYGTI